MLQFQTLGGGFLWQSEYPWCIIEVKKHFPTVFKKNYRKTGIFTQNQFSTKSIFLYTNVYVSVIYIQLNLKKIYLSVPFEVFLLKKSKIISHNFFYKLILKLKNHKSFCFSISFPSSSYRENSKHRYRKNFKIHGLNFFLLAFEVQILTKIPQKHEYLQIILVENVIRDFSYVWLTIIIKILKF
ncbi:hypothetical protein AGLY_005072 [Aphis glycines]|uniref:Uncharacterized protein n=1 Tax=Aphis glycines TaxID=307491 RepID=A0A6G0TW63_APHGL|nr:hypothetical protein AGLY_005072 [Aphis glycines]